MSSRENEVPLDRIASFDEALRVCYRSSNISPKAMAGRLGLSYRSFMRMVDVNDPCRFPPELIPQLMKESQSALPLEWLAQQMGYRLHEQSLSSVLVAIRDALVADGKSPKFAIFENGRVERP